MDTCSPHPGRAHSSSFTLLYFAFLTFPSVQTVLFRGQRGPPALPVGHDPPEKLYSHPGPARLREYLEGAPQLSAASDL